MRQCTLLLRNIALLDSSPEFRAVQKDWNTETREICRTRTQGIRAHSVVYRLNRYIAQFIDQADAYLQTKALEFSENFEIPESYTFFFTEEVTRSTLMNSLSFVL
jgi:hypothetical protein